MEMLTSTEVIWEMIWAGVITSIHHEALNLITANVINNKLCVDLRD